MIRRALGLVLLIGLTACSRSSSEGRTPPREPAMEPEPMAAARPAPRPARPAASPMAPCGSPHSAVKRPLRPAPKHPFAIDRKEPLNARWGYVSGQRWHPSSFRGSAGDRIPVLMRYASGRGRHPAVILGHGHGGDAQNMARFFGPAFRSPQIHLLAVNHPFHGHKRKVHGQDICPDRPDLLAKRWIRAVRDLRLAVAALRSHPRVDPKRIGYLGFSLGACLGGLLAGVEPDLKAAALVSPAGNYDVLARSRSSWKIGWDNQLLPRWLQVPRTKKLLATVDPVTYIRRFAPRPLLIVLGRRDSVIHPDASLALYNAAGPGRELHRHTSGHGPPGLTRRAAAKWLVQKLRQ